MSSANVEERLTKIELAITAMAKEFYSDSQERDDHGRFGGGGGGSDSGSPKGGPGSIGRGMRAEAEAKAQAKVNSYGDAKERVQLLDKWQNGHGNFHEQQALARDLLKQTNPEAAKALEASKADRLAAAEPLQAGFKEQLDGFVKDAKANAYDDDPYITGIGKLSDVGAESLKTFLSDPTPENLAKADAVQEVLGANSRYNSDFYKGDGIGTVNQRAGHAAVEDVRNEVKAAGGDPMKPLG